VLQLQIRPRIIRSFVGAPGPRQVPDGSSGRGSLRGVLPPFGEVQNAVPGNVTNTTNFIYVVAASTAKGVIRVYLLSRAGLRKAPSAGNGGPRPASYRPSASARANRGILKSREGGQRRAVSRPRDVEFTVLLLCLPPIDEQPRLILGFWAGRKSSIAGSGRPRKPEKPFANVWEAMPLIFVNGFPGPRRRPERPPKHNAFQPARKSCIN
jgi:hypothetical protein